eukprot:8691538-Lingulodinium_polyedra.AAC.1
MDGGRGVGGGVRLRRWRCRVRVAGRRFPRWRRGRSCSRRAGLRQWWFCGRLGHAVEGDGGGTLF